jgi:hypothetical protein
VHSPKLILETNYAKLPTQKYLLGKVGLILKDKSESSAPSFNLIAAFNGRWDYFGHSNQSANLSFHHNWHQASSL